jgi:hypothetical protein
MDELIKQVMNLANLDKDVAEQVVKIVVDYLKKEMPSSMSGSLDAVLRGETPTDTQGFLGKLLGGFMKK